MSTPEKRAAYQAAYEAFRAARTKLREATEAAFPVGTPVRSQIRHGVKVEGYVSLYGSAPDDGCVVVINSATGKAHRSYPFAPGYLEVLGAAPDEQPTTEDMQAAIEQSQRDAPVTYTPQVGDVVRIIHGGQFFKIGARGRVARQDHDGTWLVDFGGFDNGSLVSTRGSGACTWWIIESDVELVERPNV